VEREQGSPQGSAIASSIWLLRVLTALKVLSKASIDLGKFTTLPPYSASASAREISDRDRRPCVAVSVEGVEGASDELVLEHGTSYGVEERVPKKSVIAVAATSLVEALTVPAPRPCSIDLSRE
jgi:hypothetical protein